MSKVPVTNRKVPVTLLILIVRDICYIARDNYGKYGRDKLVLTRDTFRKSARDRAKMPVTNSKKSVSRPLLGVTGNKTNTEYRRGLFGRAAPLGRRATIGLSARCRQKLFLT